MYLYEHRQTFNRYTGEPEESELVPTPRMICDYTGLEIEDKGIEYTPYDISGSEEWYYYEDVIISERRVDVYETMHKNQGFHYLSEDKIICLLAEHLHCYDPKFLTQKQIDPLKRGLKNGNLGELITNFDSLAITMFYARMRVINKLIKEGADPLTFGIIFEED